MALGTTRGAAASAASLESAATRITPGSRVSGASGRSPWPPSPVPWAGAAAANPAARSASVGGGPLPSGPGGRRASVVTEEGTTGEVYPPLGVDFMEYHGYLLAHLHVVFFQVAHFSVA